MLTFGMFRLAKREKEKEFETCVICGKLTDVRRDTPIRERIGYEEGSGQLCIRCYRRMLDPGRRQDRDAHVWFEAASRRRSP